MGYFWQKLWAKNYLLEVFNFVLVKNACTRKRLVLKYQYMDKKTAKRIVQTLSLVYENKPALKYSSAYELLIAVILSAQCTDERVNRVTAKLFEKYNTPEKMLNLKKEELEKYIFSCGLYKTKAKNILSASKDIIEKFGGQVPNNLKDLQSLAGVGRKTANVVYSVAFGGDAIAVDTHVFRVANRIGLSKASTPLGVEKALMNILDKKDWSSSHHFLIYLGRNQCKSQKPKCESCSIKCLCEKNIR